MKKDSVLKLKTHLKQKVTVIAELLYYQIEMKLYICVGYMLSNLRERSRSPMERDRSPVRGRPVGGFADARFKA